MVNVSPAVGARSILKAATALFAEEGFDGASIAAIAEKAGVCKANVFHHYPSKDELYLAVMREAAAANADYAEDLCRAPGKSSDKVRKLVEFEIRHMLADRQRARLLQREISNSGPEARSRKLARTVFQRNFSAMVSVFEQGRQTGEFQARMDPAAAAMLLFGAVQCYFNCRDVLREFREARSLDTPEAYIERITALILSGAALRNDS